jgi:hypothetical protein
MDLDALINSAASTGNKTKKSDTPVMDVGNKDDLELIARWVKASKAVDSAEAEMAEVEEKLVPKVAAFHSKAIVGLREVPSTVKVVSTSGNMMVDIAKCQYKKVPVTDKPKLVRIFDPSDVESAPTPVFNSLFTKTTEIKLTADALQDSEILTKLVLAVGQENFKKYFEVTTNLTPTVVFHQSRFLDANLGPKIKLAIEQGLITPYKPSFKAKA